MSSNTNAVTINIKRSGANIGTIGWLHAGLSDGTVTITERIGRKTGHAVLCMDAKPGDHEKIVYLGSYNPYGLTNSELKDSETYQAYHLGDPADSGAMVDTIGMTDACARTVLSIAAKWAAQRNEENNQEVPLQVNVSIA